MENSRMSFEGKLDKKDFVIQKYDYKSDRNLQSIR